MQQVVKKPTAQAQVSAPKSASRMTLASVTRNKGERPPRILLYGVEKIGKSSFAAQAPGAVFLCPEDGLTRIDAPVFPEPKTWDEVFEAIEELRAGSHDYKYLVADTVDWLEPLLWESICKRDGEKNIESYGYGKGFNVALDEWRFFISRLEKLRSERGMGIILLAHSWVKPFKNPSGDDYDRYELKVHAKAGGMLKEWCDAVLFAAFETYAVEDKRKRVRGVSTGARLIYTERTAAYDAGNRFNLPPELPLDWQAFADAMAANRAADPETIKARIAEMLVGVADDFKAKVELAVQKAPGDAAYLARVLNRLAATISTQENAQ